MCLRIYLWVVERTDGMRMLLVATAFTFKSKHPFATPRRRSKSGAECNGSRERSWQNLG